MGWLYIASKRVTVQTPLRGRSQLALPVARGELDNFVYQVWEPLTDKQRVPRIGHGLPASGNLVRTDLTGDRQPTVPSAMLGGLVQTSRIRLQHSR